MNDRIPSRLWIDALMRRAQIGGAFATIVRLGDDERGEVVVKVRSADGFARLYVRAFALEGEPRFEALPEDGAAEEAVIDALIARREASDRDLWVVEIEDRDGRHFLTEKVADPHSKMKP